MGWESNRDGHQPGFDPWDASPLARTRPNQRLASVIHRTPGAPAVHLDWLVTAPRAPGVGPVTVEVQPARSGPKAGSLPPIGATLCGVVPLIGLAVGLATLHPAVAPPPLDVPAAISVLETRQVHLAPGAVATIDVAAVTRELKPDRRVVVAPFARRSPDYLEDVYKPLEKWGKPKGVRVITVTGLYVWSRPANLTELRQQTAYMDVTGPVLRELRGGTEPSYPAYAVVAPTREQVDDLAGKLRRNPVHNAEGLADRFTQSAETIQRRLGTPVRVAVLPVLKPGAPFVDYAPALAKEFPGEIVMVANGYWVAVAGEDQDRLDSARNYVYAENQDDSFFTGTTVDRRIGTIVQRLAELGGTKPLAAPRPPPRDLAQTIAHCTPPLLGGSAVLLVVGAVAGVVSGRRRRRRVALAEARKVKALAYARISELAAALTLVPRPEAADRYARARELFDQARVAEADRVAAEGLALL